MSDMTDEAKISTLKRMLEQAKDHITGKEIIPAEKLGMTVFMYETMIKEADDA